MRIMFPFRLGFFYVGRDHEYDLDAAIIFGWGRRKNAPPGEVACRVNGKLAWNWLPERIYQHNSPPMRPDVAWSPLWTGRFVEFVGLGRWRRIGFVSRIRPNRNRA